MASATTCHKISSGTSGGEGANDAKANFGEWQAAKFFEFFGTVTRNFHGHIEAAIRSEAAKDGTAKRGERGFASGAAVSHREGFRE
jgi:hypothetical protein